MQYKLKLQKMGCSLISFGRILSGLGHRLLPDSRVSGVGAAFESIRGADYQINLRISGLL
jgi:hypothetical protein